MKPKYVKIFFKTFPLLYPKGTQFNCGDEWKDILWNLSGRLNEVVLKERYQVDRAYKQNVPLPEIQIINDTLIYYIPNATPTMKKIIIKETLENPKKKPRNT